MLSNRAASPGHPPPATPTPTPEDGAGVVGVLVTYVEPDPMRPDYSAVLGRFTMLVPPRIGESVVLQPAFSADWHRYNIVQVIHFMPGRGVSGRECPAEVTIVVTQHQPPEAVERLMGFLTRTRNGYRQGGPVDAVEPPDPSG